MDEAQQPGSEPEVLSQSDVEKLLAQVADQEAWTQQAKPGAEPKRPEPVSVQPYDFRMPVFLSATELRKLRVEHDEFVQALAARLSNYLRLEMGLQMSKITTMPFEEFAQTLANPTHIVLFKVDPLPGICVLEVNPRLGLTIVDRLMGGAGHSLDVDRDLSEIEVALLDQAIQIIIGQWCNHWNTTEELRPSILAHESNGRFVQTSPAGTIMLLLSMEARIGECLEKINIGFPWPVLEPLIQHLSIKLDSAVRESEEAPLPAPRWKPEFDSIQVRVSAHVAPRSFSARELSVLKTGDVLTWNPEVTGQVELRVATLPKFRGRLGRRGKKWAVEINQILKT